MNESQTQYLDVIDNALTEAKKQGASAAEVAIGVETGLSVTARLGDVETLEYNHDKGLGITVFMGQQKGSSSTSDFSPSAIREAVAAACSIAKYTAEDVYSGLADKALMAWDYPDLALNYIWELDSEHALELALECEQVARQYDKRITNSEGASVASHSGVHIYGNSHGFAGGYPTTRHSISCSVIGQDGDTMQRDYWYTAARNHEALDSAKSVGEKAAQRTLARLNGRRLPTQQAPVLFAPETASGLLGHFTRAISGGSLYRKTSFLLDSLNQQLFPDWFHIEEQPHLKGALGSAPFDSEGVITQARDLVKKGVLLGYILSSYSARRLGMQTTGNAGGTHNLIASGNEMKSQAELLKMMDKGLLVTELMGQGVNHITGDYSRGAAGFWVENGEIQFPVEEITIAGNLRDMFRNIQMIGNDADRRRNIQIGSILLDNMAIAGQ